MSDHSTRRAVCTRFVQESKPYRIPQWVGRGEPVVGGMVLVFIWMRNDDMLSALTQPHS